MEEVILVDDASDMDHVKEPLDNYMAQYPKARQWMGIIFMWILLMKDKLNKIIKITIFITRCESSDQQTGWV